MENRVTLEDRLWAKSATELGLAFERGTLLPSQVLDSVLARIDLVNPVLNVFAVLDRDGAIRAARESDARWQAGKPRGPLDGVPITIKDNINVAGLPCSWGSDLFASTIPEKDETPVARLRAAGAVILGKTTVPEFAMSRGHTNTKAFGVTRNPWNPKLTPGSSTGGGAAAVAAGIAPITLATDGGGSIRRPASYCGLLGIKTSTGFVGRRHGLPAMVIGQETIGPLTRTVDDMALVLEVIQGPESGDRLSAGTPAVTREPAELGKLRILYIPRFGANDVDAPIVASCARAAANLAGLGHDVVEGDVPFDLALLERSVPKLMNAGMAWVVRDLDWQGQVADNFPPMIEAGSKALAVDYLDAMVNLQEVYAQLAAAFETYDLIMTPSTGAMPWAAEVGGPPIIARSPAS